MNMRNRSMLPSAVDLGREFVTRICDKDIILCERYYSAFFARYIDTVNHCVYTVTCEKERVTVLWTARSSAEAERKASRLCTCQRQRTSLVFSFLWRADLTH